MTENEAELVSYIGHQHTMELERRFGGAYLYIPAQADPEGEIAKAVGYQAARTLAAKLGGFRFWIPQCLLQQERNRDICRQAAAGESTATLAERHHLTPRQVRNIIAKGNP